MDFEEIKYEMKKRNFWKPVMYIREYIVFYYLAFLKPGLRLGAGWARNCNLILAAVENTVLNEEITLKDNPSCRQVVSWWMCKSKKSNLPMRLSRFFGNSFRNVDLSVDFSNTYHPWQSKCGSIKPSEVWNFKVARIIGPGDSGKLWKLNSLRYTLKN